HFAGRRHAVRCLYGSGDARSFAEFRGTTTELCRSFGDGSHHEYLGGGRSVATVCTRNRDQQSAEGTRDCGSQDQDRQSGFASAGGTAALRLSAAGVATGCGDAALAAADASPGSAGERPHAVEEPFALHPASLFDSAAG